MLKKWSFYALLFLFRSRFMLPIYRRMCNNCFKIIRFFIIVYRYLVGPKRNENTVWVLLIVYSFILNTIIMGLFVFGFQKTILMNNLLEYILQIWPYPVYYWNNKSRFWITQHFLTCFLKIFALALSTRYTIKYWQNLSEITIPTNRATLWLHCQATHCVTMLT